MFIIESILSISLDAAPWLVIGFLIAGLVKAFISESVLNRYVGGAGFTATVRAAVIGMPLPLCSCGAIPTAFSLYRGGAGKGPSTAFLVGTPGVGVDSITITYALLGPFMMIARVAGAVVTAITTGLLVSLSRSRPPAYNDDVGNYGSCCNGESCAATPDPAPSSMAKRLGQGIRYSFTEFFDDISLWLLGGLVMAGLLLAFLPPEALASVGSGFLPMLFMAVIGIPMYICATAATPIAAAMLLTGVSPGTVLVFLLAGPVTSMATLGVLRREMGNQALFIYLGGIITVSVTLGLLIDLSVSYFGIDIGAQAGSVGELIPGFIQWASLILLLVLGIRPLRRIFGL